MLTPDVIESYNISLGIYLQNLHEFITIYTIVNVNYLGFKYNHYILGIVLTF